MNDDSQVPIADSFLALFVAPGRARPRASRHEIAARHEFCEDLAQLLVDRAAETHAMLGVDEAEVLARMRRGLLDGDAAPVSAAEAQWVVCRLAELMGWPFPPPPAVAADAPDGKQAPASSLGTGAEPGGAGGGEAGGPGAGDDAGGDGRAGARIGDRAGGAETDGKQRP